MSILVIRSEAAAGPTPDDRGVLAGFGVVSCGHGIDDRPCIGVGGTCPLAGGDVEAVVDYRGDRHDLRGDEMGAVCALRQGFPLLVDGVAGLLAGSATVREPGEPLDLAIDRATREHQARQAAPLLREVRRIVAAHGLDPEGCAVHIQRRGTAATVDVVVPVPLSTSLESRLAVRVHALLGAAPSPAQVVDVRVRALDAA